MSFALFLRHDELGYRQQPCAELQVRAFRSLQIDFKAHPVLIQNEVDDPATLGEAGRIPNGQNAGPCKALQDVSYLLLLRRSDEQDLAGPGLRHAIGMRDLE